MKINDIKNIWKVGIEKDITPYSEEELSEMIVRSARKSIKAIYPGTIFRLIVISIACFLIITLFLKEQSIEKRFVDLVALIIISVSYFFWERSAYKMKKYNSKPVKAWLEYRITEIEKSVKFNNKYYWVIYGCSFLCAMGIYALYQVVSSSTPQVLTVIVIPLGILIYLLIVRHSLNQNYKKVLHELKDLYKQFEDINK